MNATPDPIAEFYQKACEILGHLPNEKARPGMDQETAALRWANPSKALDAHIADTRTER